jgi:hypothetical protein
MLTPEQEQAIKAYCDAIFDSGAESKEFFYRLGMSDRLNLKKMMKKVFLSLSQNK